jgi:hypothetical protein
MGDFKAEKGDNLNADTTVYMFYVMQFCSLGDSFSECEDKLPKVVLSLLSNSIEAIKLRKDDFNASNTF